MEHQFLRGMLPRRAKVWGWGQTNVHRGGYHVDASREGLWHDVHLAEHMFADNKAHEFFRKYLR